jgi:hypothetical protein
LDLDAARWRIKRFPLLPKMINIGETRHGKRPEQMIRPLVPLIALALISGCNTPGTSADSQRPDPAAPVQSADGRCWASVVTPAVYEHVMGEIQVVQAEIAPDGTVIRPPIYRKGPVPRIVRPRGEIKFEAPCPDQMTPEFISSVQRALAARGYFSGEINGRISPATTAAVRKYQTERGLASGQLSLESARSLGLIAVDRASL